ncbi:MAG: Fic family protein [Thermosynechococcaceae cyanobacterium MS004]|nr:Fic family protein [Thermosynechococcaceae cyanobacterium MS004]
MFDKNQPYNDLPLLPPSSDLETKAVLKRAIAANRALAELKGVGDLIPNQTVLLSTLALQEAKLSSEIENIVTTNDELYRALADDDHHTDPQTKEVLHYNTALWFGVQSLMLGQPLATRLFEDIARNIKPSISGVRKIPGTKIVDGEGEVIYTPPEGEALLRDKLENLENFIYDDSDDLDPLVKMAVIHYQFEAIHPFTDGNGRTGRILNMLYLVEQKLLEFPVLYLSSYIIQHKNDYYKGLRHITEKESWEPWILYMLQAIQETALLTRNKILDIKKLMEAVTESVKQDLPKVYSKELVEVLFRQPYCKIRFLEEANIAKRQTASMYLQELERVGVLQSYKKGRERYFINVPFYNLLIR